MSTWFDHEDIVFFGFGKFLLKIVDKNDVKLTIFKESNIIKEISIKDFASGFTKWIKKMNSGKILIVLDYGIIIY